MNTAYIEFNGKICVAASTLADAGVITPNLRKGGNVTYPLFDKWRSKAKECGYLCTTGGNGRPSLIELKAIPNNYRNKIIEKLGNPEQTYNPIEKFFTIDAAARTFYDTYRYPSNNKALEPYQIERYTTNASVLNALAKLREYRKLETKIKGNPKRDLRQGLADDSIAFNEVLKLKYNGIQHTLPSHPRKLNDKITEYLRVGYSLLIDGRANNTNAQVVTPEMLQLWNEMFAGQRHKPTHIEVSSKYKAFLSGKLHIINSETGELFDHKADCYREVSDSSVYNWLAEWTNRIGVFKARAGNRKTYMDRFTPSARMLRPSVGAILSVDDYQPPFKWDDGAGNRMWFYAAQDLGSTAITAWVWGDSKEGIIEEFYRQLVRNYAEWNVCLPYEIECEASLNSSFTDTFLAPGAMFQKVRVLPNKPRAKRIERTVRDLRLAKASKHPAFVARPDAKDENYQQKPGKQIYLSKEEIVEFELSVIEDWNNELHPDQDVYPGLTRWQVFEQHQNPKLQPINWKGILPHLGKIEPTSMKMGRIRLQYLDRVVGFDGAPALGESLIRVMNEIEGQEVNAYWLDGNDGEVLKAHVYSDTGRFVCEVLDDLPFHRSELDQTERCKRNMQLYFAYERTVEAHANRIARSITGVELIPLEVPKQGGFKIRGLRRNIPATEATGAILEENAPERTYEPISNDLADRM
jgi:hypothetical protein